MLVSKAAKSELRMLFVPVPSASLSLLKLRMLTGRGEKVIKTASFSTPTFYFPG